MEEVHLKSHQYYSDLYDRFTVEQCRRTEESFKREREPLPSEEKLTKEQATQMNKLAMEWYLHIEMGERYLNRAKTIREWMDRDQKKDELYESAQPPEDIRCLTCRNRVNVTFKDLWSGMDGKEDRVLFMFDCPNKCMPRRAFFSDGEEWRIKPDPCLKCNTALDKKTEERGEGYTLISTCPNCGNIETEEHEWFKPKDEEIDLNFAKDRDRFCLTEEKGREYQDEKYRMEQMGELGKKWKEEDERRKKKLEENPKGYHLEGRYSCGICGSGTPEGDNWYDEHGIKCLICQKVIDEGEVPATVASDKESWYSKYDLEDRFNLKGAALNRWIKEGILKSRTISVYGKGSHYELFLIEDNKGFCRLRKWSNRNLCVRRKTARSGHTLSHGIDSLIHLSTLKTTALSST
jgi:hypothetical protein